MKKSILCLMLIIVYAMIHIVYAEDEYIDEETEGLPFNFELLEYDSNSESDQNWESELSSDFEERMMLAPLSSESSDFSEDPDSVNFEDPDSMTSSDESLLSSESEESLLESEEAPFFEPYSSDDSTDSSTSSSSSSNDSSSSTNSSTSNSTTTTDQTTDNSSSQTTTSSSSGSSSNFFSPIIRSTGDSQSHSSTDKTSIDNTTKSTSDTSSDSAKSTSSSTASQTNSDSVTDDSNTQDNLSSSGSSGSNTNTQTTDNTTVNTQPQDNSSQKASSDNTTINTQPQEDSSQQASSSHTQQDKASTDEVVPTTSDKSSTDKSSTGQDSSNVESISSSNEDSTQDETNKTSKQEKNENSELNQTLNSENEDKSVLEKDSETNQLQFKEEEDFLKNTVLTEQQMKCSEDHCISTFFSTIALIDISENYNPEEDQKLTLNPTLNSQLVQDNKDGSLLYIPSPIFKGTDIFEYTVTNAQGKNQTYSIAVEVKRNENPFPPVQCNQTFLVHDQGVRDSLFLTFNSKENRVKVLGTLYQGIDIESLALDSDNEKLYAMSGNGNGISRVDGYLYHVNSQTGQLQFIGDTCFSEVSALAINPIDGMLYGWSAGGKKTTPNCSKLGEQGPGIIRIDPINADSQLVTPSPFKYSAKKCKGNKKLEKECHNFEGLTLSADSSTFYASDGANLWVLEENKDWQKKCPFFSDLNNEVNVEALETMIVKEKSENGQKRNEDMLLLVKVENERGQIANEDLERENNNFSGKETVLGSIQQIAVLGFDPKSCQTFPVLEKTFSSFQYNANDIEAIAGPIECPQTWEIQFDGGNDNEIVCLEDPYGIMVKGTVQIQSEENENSLVPAFIETYWQPISPLDAQCPEGNQSGGSDIQYVDCESIFDELQPITGTSTRFSITGVWPYVSHIKESKDVLIETYYGVNLYDEAKNPLSIGEFGKALLGGPSLCGDQTEEECVDEQGQPIENKNCPAPESTTDCLDEEGNPIESEVCQENCLDEEGNPIESEDCPVVDSTDEESKDCVDEDGKPIEATLCSTEPAEVETTDCVDEEGNPIESEDCPAEEEKVEETEVITEEETDNNSSFQAPLNIEAIKNHLSGYEYQLDEDKGILWLYFNNKQHKFAFSEEISSDDETCPEKLSLEPSDDVDGLGYNDLIVTYPKPDCRHQLLLHLEVMEEESTTDESQDEENQEKTSSETVDSKEEQDSSDTSEAENLSDTQKDDLQKQDDSTTESSIDSEEEELSTQKESTADSEANESSEESSNVQESDDSENQASENSTSDKTSGDQEDEVNKTSSKDSLSPQEEEMDNNVSSKDITGNQEEEDSSHHDSSEVTSSSSSSSQKNSSSSTSEDTTSNSQKESSSSSSKDTSSTQKETTSSSDSSNDQKESSSPSSTEESSSTSSSKKTSTTQKESTSSGSSKETSSSQKESTSSSSSKETSTQKKSTSSSSSKETSSRQEESTSNSSSQENSSKDTSSSRENSTKNESSSSSQSQEDSTASNEDNSD